MRLHSHSRAAPTQSRAAKSPLGASSLPATCSSYRGTAQSTFRKRASYWRRAEGP
jgi:hypothetical protein